MASIRNFLNSAEESVHSLLDRSVLVTLPPTSTIAMVLVNEPGNKMINQEISVRGENALERTSLYRVVIARSGASAHHWGQIRAVLALSQGEPAG